MTLGVPTPPEEAWRSALIVAVPYLLFAGLWIVYSDQAVEVLAGDLSEATLYQTIKGIAFVVLSAALIFGLALASQNRQSRLHQARLRAEHDLSSVLETVNDGVWTVHPDRSVVWSGHWPVLSGYGNGDLSTVETWLEQIHTDDRATFHRRLETLLAGLEDRLVHDHRIRTANGTWLWVRTRAQAAAPADGSIRRSVVGTYTDLTAERHQEQHLTALAQDLATARTELASLASAAAHDLRQPVREVASYAQLLHRRLGPGLPADAHEDLNYLINAAQHLTGLLDGLLRAVETSRSMVAHAEVPLSGLIAKCLNNYADDLRVADGQAEVGDLPIVRGDAQKLRQMFDALICNAIKFRSPTRRLKITITAQRDGAWWRIMVADNGIGLPPEYAEEIFQAFRRLHGRGEYDGAGMGLAICRTIAAHHGGTIHATGSAEGGTRLVISLPVQKDTRTAA